LSGVRHTPRFDVHLIYEKKIDAAAERGRLQKELERIEKEIANGQRQLGMISSFEGSGAGRGRAPPACTGTDCFARKTQKQTARAALDQFSQQAGLANEPYGLEQSPAYRIIENALLEDRATSDASSYACIDPISVGATILPSRLHPRGARLRGAYPGRIRDAGWSRGFASRSHQPPGDLRRRAVAPGTGCGCNSVTTRG